MPYYDFKCTNEHITETLCSYSEMEKGIDCPVCQNKSERIFSVTPVKPTFGYAETIWNQREQHRKSMTGSQLNQPLVN